MKVQQPYEISSKQIQLLTEEQMQFMPAAAAAAEEALPHAQPGVRRYARRRRSERHSAILGHNHMAGRGIMAIMPAPRAPPAA